MDKKIFGGFGKNILAVAGVIFLASVLSPVLLLGNDLPVAKPEDVGMSSARLARIAPAMQRYIDKGLVPGTVTLVARKGKVVHLEALGYRNVESKNVMTQDTIFRLASMTKPITTVACMMLLEEGHFLLSDPYQEMDSRIRQSCGKNFASGRCVRGRDRHGSRQKRYYHSATTDSYCRPVQCLSRHKSGRIQ